MTALEEEAVKTLTGESKMDLNFINSLIAKSSANLKKVLAEKERIRTEIENDAKLDGDPHPPIETIHSWAPIPESKLFRSYRGHRIVCLRKLF